MKWDCGLTADERWELTYKWHRWFAWWPTRIASRDCRWLEVIERRRVWGGIMNGMYWEYREPLSDGDGSK